MAISITLADADKDGTGINFDSYLKAFDKEYIKSGYGGFINEDSSGSIPDGDYVITGDDYVSWDGENKGQSVILEGGKDGWEYVFDGHTMSGDISAITFGTQTKAHDDNPEYTNNGEIRIAFDEFEVENYGSHWVSDLAEGETEGLLNFLNGDSIEFTGSAGKDTFTSFAKADVLHGEGDTDKLDGAKGNDTLYGDEGRDRLTGSAGADTFVFEAGDGKDRITDFGRGADLIDFSSQFADFDAVMEAATQGKNGVTIAYDGGSVLLEDIKLADLSESDFVFPVA